ncbi:hypothetical protein WMY93_015076 [Mugilogobius chulae]|uniref:BTB domain-containing protein n=1 Tax=Mugilogobius chulae TaxID=88201 RepID=A0AAW0P917_9GOBI
MLAASSDFFRGMFTSGMKESSQNCVSLPFLFAPELESLIDCSYTGHLHLNWDCVFEITCTALQLQFPSVLSLCFKFMHEQIDANFCLDVLSFAEAYGMTELQDVANDFVLRNFWEVSGTVKFLDLSAEKLVDFLKCDGLCAPSELMVFRAVISWIEASLEDRLCQASLLMSAVRFPLMTFREFCEVRAINLRMECVENSKDFELYRSALKEFGNQDAEVKCRVRNPKEVLVLVGGDQLNPDMGQRIASRQVWFANCLRSGTGLVKDMEWRKLGEIPDQPKFRHGVASLEGELYVIGGCYFYTKEDIMKSAYRYNPEQNSWKRLADMIEFRSNFSLIVNEGRLFAIGGDKEINTNVDSVEMYDPHTDQWSFVRSLDLPLSGQAATVHNNAILISGGFNCKYECLVSLFLYHPSRGSTYLSDMSCDRAQHSMESLRGCLYVAGGVCNLRKFYTDQLVCEMYCPRTDSWSVFGNLPLPHVGAPSAVWEDKLYILGGYCQEDYTESGLVHRFDPSTNRWESVGRLPGAVTDIRLDKTQPVKLQAPKVSSVLHLRTDSSSRSHNMDLKTCVVLVLLGFSSVKSQRGDFTMPDWFQSKLDIILKLEERMNNVDKCCKAIENLEIRLNDTLDELTKQKQDINKLKEENEELKKNTGKASPQVAFSVSLADVQEVYKGPCTDKTLVFKRVFSNVGNAYDSNTGIFTAPVAGSYFFTFNTYGYNSHTTGAILMKNSQIQVSTYESVSSDGADSSSNSVLLTLVPGDTLHLELWDNGRVFDNANGHTTFTGFLVFPTSI